MESVMKRKLLFGAVMLTILLTACQSDRTPTSVATPTQGAPSPTFTAVPTDTPSPSPAPTDVVLPSDTPTPTQKAEATELSDVYTTDLRNDIYSIVLPEISSGYMIDEGEIRDGYMLLRLREKGDSLKEKLALFPVLKPEQIKFYDIDDFMRSYKLADKGRVLEVIHRDGAIRAYSDSFELIGSYSSGFFAYIGCDSKERCWYLDDSGRFCYINLFTDETESFGDGGYRSVDGIILEEDDTVWFSVSGMAAMSFPVRINTATKELEDIDNASVVPINCASIPIINGPYINYYSPSFWYFTHLTELDRINIFKKAGINDAIWKCNNTTAVSVNSQNNYENGTFTYFDTYSAIDLTNGGIISSVTTELFDTQTTLTGLSLTANNEMLFVAAKNGQSHLYLWDFSNRTATPDSTFHSISFADLSNEVEKKAAALETKYGVSIFYKEEDLTGVSDTYEMFPSTEYISLINALEELENCMSEYPKNFFNEILGSHKEALEIYLSDGFRAYSSDVLQYPSSFVTLRDNSIALCIDVTVAQSTYAKTFAHEIMHVMEYRINEYATATQKDIWDYWLQNLCSPEYPYYDRYVDSDGYEYTDPTATAMGGYSDAWFIDTYGRSNALEDRARIIEYMYAQSSDLFTSENLIAKGRFLIAVIREVFPSIQSSSRPVLWEKLLGIDGPSFSDYDFSVLVPKG